MKLKILSPLIIIILTLIITGASNATETQEKLSTAMEMKLALNEITANQKVEAEEFIFQAKYGKADKEARLVLIEEQQKKFSSALDEIANEREELREIQRNGTITQEVFTGEMKTLGLKTALSAKTIKKMDDDIAELKKSIDEKNKQKFASIEEHHNELKNRTRIESPSIEDSIEIPENMTEAKNESSNTAIEKPTVKPEHEGGYESNERRRGEG